MDDITNRSPMGISENGRGSKNLVEWSESYFYFLYLFIF
jgi:hypothetical protein